jgi:signal transduction histidine kinase/FixJ family two-component response regulator
MTFMKKYRVLYVEDDQALARLVKKKLGRMNYEVDLAPDAQQGSELFQASGYDALIIDQTLPGLSGLDMVRSIAMQGDLPPAIMVTGTGNESIAVEAMKLGMSDYLVKDIEGGFLNLLPVVIENALQQRQVQNERIRLERELALRSRIADIFLTTPEEEMYSAVLNVFVGAVKSKYGVFAYLDEDGAAILAGIKTDPRYQRDMLNQSRRLAREAWTESAWGVSLREKKSFFGDELSAFPLSREPIFRSLLVPIAYQEEVIGFIGVANKDGDYLQEECEMLENIARYIAPPLDARLKKDRQEKRRRRAEEELRNLTRKLSIKVQVTNCLHQISELFQNRQRMADEIMQGVVDLVPSGWQYPEITCARIVLVGNEYRTSNYRETAWKISSPINVDREMQGTLEVCYLEEKPGEAEGPFLQEEHALLNDISERLGMFIDRRQIESELTQAHRLEAVGQLAAGIAHEINTPTQYVGDNARFLRDAFSDINDMFDEFHKLLQAAKEGSLSAELLAEAETSFHNADLDYLHKEIPKAIEQSIEGVNRVAGIVRAMKEFSHPGSEQKELVDLAHAIENALTISRNEWKYVAEVITDFHANLPLVACLPGDLNQVILSLIVNAAQAISEKIDRRSGQKGTITIRTRKDGQWAEIRVEDTGAGIAEQYRQRIFDPFFTTKEPGKGTGQGLFIAHGIITKKHGGTIDFQTKTGEGTTFVVRLPLQEKAKTINANALPGGREIITN